MHYKHLRILGLITLVLCLTGCAATTRSNTPQPDPVVLKLQSYLLDTNIKVSRLKKANVFKLTLPADLTFQKDSASLKPEFAKPLNAVARLLKAEPRFLAKITGHTDIHGTLRYNQLLSEKRAQNIANYLAAHGIPKNRLQTAGYGINDPVASNKKLTGRAKNRRVEILLYSL